jgi:hypothetical protein
MKISAFILLLLIVSCNNASQKNESFWKQQKKAFKYLNKTEFISDYELMKDLKNLTPIKHEMLDTLLGERLYLYSWQERDTSKIEFTIVKDDGELGLKIYYFILDKKDKLISWRHIGGRGGEPGYSFETKTTIINKDTMISISSITEYWDSEKQTSLTKTKGDTTFSFLIIDKKGKIREHVFKEVKTLNFNN